MKNKVASLLAVLMVIFLQSKVIYPCQLKFKYIESKGRYHGIAYGKSFFVAVGEKGLIRKSKEKANWKEWEEVSPIVSHTLHDIAFFGDRFVAVGDKGTILTSLNDKKWTQIQGDFKKQNLNAVTFGKKFVALGDNGIILTEINKDEWVQRELGVEENLNSIDYGNLYVAVGDAGTILSGNDGIKWTRRASGLTARNLNDITYGKRYVVVGNAGTILTSEDGIKWVKRSSGVTADLTSAAAINKKGILFVVGGHEGAILTSTDGISWESASVKTSIQINAFVYGDLKFVGTGKDGFVHTVLSEPVGSYTDFHSDQSDPRIKDENGNMINGYYPSVVYRSGKEKPYKMWYTSVQRPKKFETRKLNFTRSKDGKIWDKPVEVKGLQNPHHVQVVYLYDRKKYKYRIYYWVNEIWKKHIIGIIMTAESEDGITWKNDTPITQDDTCKLISGEKYYGTTGPIAVWYNPNPVASVSDKIKSIRPCDYKFALWYCCVISSVGNTDRAGEGTSLAVSDDGIKFYQWHLLQGKDEAKLVIDHGDKEKWDSNYLGYGTIIPKTEESGKLIFYYSGGQVRMHEGIGAAFSNDFGVTWKKYKNNPIFETEPKTWHSSRCYTPCVIYDIENICNKKNDEPLYKIWITGDDSTIGMGYLYIR